MKMLTAICAFCILPLLGRSAQHRTLPSGEVIGWGVNPSGQATGESPGAVTSVSIRATGAVTVVHQILTNAVSIAAGDGHGLAVLEDGSVAGWGWNIAGQATGVKRDGIAAAGRVTLPTGQQLTGVRQVAAGSLFSLALRNKGSVVAWGELTDGQPMKVPGGLSNVIAISAGWDHALALKADGALIWWGRGNAPPRDFTNLVAIAASRSEYGSDLALSADGTVREWAVRGVSEPRRPPTGLTSVIAVAAGWNHNLALRRDGTVFGWGSTEAATGVPVTSTSRTNAGLVSVDGHVLTNITAISAANEFSLGLRSDGSVAAWGRMQNGLNPAGAPADLTGVIAIAAGEDFSLAITTNLWESRTSHTQIADPRWQVLTGSHVEGVEKKGIKP